ncbi:hypothetical protein GCM10011367_18330 [Marinicauda pacifica]|nr:hypothetical protein GCM10011367_18330 [Marinicauda pacifica]
MRKLRREASTAPPVDPAGAPRIEIAVAIAPHMARQWTLEATPATNPLTSPKVPSPHWDNIKWRLCPA